jgi:hypothetical protein
MLMVEWNDEYGYTVSLTAGDWVCPYSAASLEEVHTAVTCHFTNEHDRLKVEGCPICRVVK